MYFYAHNACMYHSSNLVNIDFELKGKGTILCLKTPGKIKTWWLCSQTSMFWRLTKKQTKCRSSFWWGIQKLVSVSNSAVCMYNLAVFHYVRIYFMFYSIFYCICNLSSPICCVHSVLYNILRTMKVAKPFHLLPVCTYPFIVLNWVHVAVVKKNSPRCSQQDVCGYKEYRQAHPEDCDQGPVYEA